MSRIIALALLTNSVCVGGSSWLRLPGGMPGGGKQPKDNQVAPWQLGLPDIDTTLQMARLSMIVYDDDCVEALGKAGQAKGKLGKAGRAQGQLKDDDAYLSRLKEEGGANTEMWFYECAAEGTEAAVTYSPKTKRCTIIFRGTEVSCAYDILADLNVFKTKLGPNSDTSDDHPKVRVHSGFHKQYFGKVTHMENDGDVPKALRATGSVTDKMLETALFEKVQKVLKKSPDTTLCVTGHSLGGALSVLCGIRLALKFPDNNVQVINFGCPKVGNAAFAELLNTRKNLRVHRVAHERDLVTRVPNGLFTHAGHTLQIGGADFKPRAFKWHASRSAMTNWNPLRGRVSDHFMDGYLNALHSHKHSGKNCAGEKPWVSEYDTTQ